jgi:hypothetical protein
VHALSPTGQCKTFDASAPPRAHRAPQGGPAASARAGVRPGPPLPRRARPGGGPRNRHGRGRPHRAGHPHRGVRRSRRGHRVVRARVGQVPDRSHQVRRRPGRPHQDRPGALPGRAAPHRQPHRPEPGVRRRVQPVPVPRPAPTVAR